MKSLAKKEAELAHLFYRNGCCRMPDEGRVDEGSGNYKKGWELRFTAGEDEIEPLLDLLRDTGFKPGKPYKKNSHRTIVPVYGKEAMLRFDKLLKRVEKGKL